MSTELMIYDRITDPMAAVVSLGRSIAISKMFGCDSTAQGEVFAMECLARRIPPLMLAERYHVIHGKLSMKSDAMLAEFDRQGGKHKPLCRTADRAEIELTLDGHTERFAITWTEAQQEPFIYEGREGDVLKALADNKPPVIKAKYRTPRSRMQMMWARVVSDGVRVMMPGVNCGTYTPEEVDDFSGSNGAVNGAATTKSQPAESDEIVDAEIVATETVEEDATPIAAATEPVNGGCSSAQSSRIKELWGLLGATPSQRETMLNSRKAATVRSLTANQAAELIGKLEDRLPPTEQTEQPQAAATGSMVEIVQRIKQQLSEIEQVHPGTIAKVKAKLAESKIPKLENLKREDALGLMGALRGSQLEGYLGISVWAFSPLEPAKN